MADQKTAQAATASKPKVELTIAQVQEDLKNGVDRKAMQTKYGLKRADIIRLFKHPKLKGLKVHREGSVEPGFVILDDVEPTTNGAKPQTQPATEDKSW